MILRHFADTLVFATNSETRCNEVSNAETPVKEPYELESDSEQSETESQQ